jgi:prepilin-type N-terminal cleavage/methylation domain-containing protein
MPLRQIALRRPGFTLLEMLLATMIGVLLMGALYVAIDVQLRHAQAGRDVIEESLLVRAVLTHMADDIKASVAAQPPALPASSGSSGGMASGAGTPATGAAPASGTSTPTTGTTQAATSPTTPSTPSPVSATPAFTLGLQGDSQRLILFVTRVPRELNLSPDAVSSGETPAGVSDLKRITYWLAGGSGEPLGLARQVVKAVTADDSTAPLPPDIPDEASLVIADEVKSIQFQYWDGTAWQDSWDATVVASGAAGPMGPPQLVAVTIGIVPPGSPARPGTDPVLKYYRHVVEIPTANGSSQQSTTTQ